MPSSSCSYLTRRQRSYATAASHNNPHSLGLPSSGAGGLIPNHERGSLQSSQAGSRNRRRGSPFAALSEAYKPPRAGLFRSGGRGGIGGGEVLALRSSNFAWPKTVETLPADPRRLQRLKDGVLSAAEMEVTSRTNKAVLPLSRKRSTDENAVESRWVSSSSAATAAAAAESAAVAAQVIAEIIEAAATGAATPQSQRQQHRRSVSWGRSSVHEFVVNGTQTQADVYSPDLHSIELAKALAAHARDPELRRAALAVENCRRHAAMIVRSLTSKQDGGVDGVEEACRLYSWREAAFLRETDELVRRIVVGAGEEEVWRLKASYRTARRKMEDHCSD